MSIPRIDPSLGIADLKQSGDRLMEAAYDYWEMCHKTGLVQGAVVFLTDAEGQMVIFTRGEYRAQLMQNIDELGLGEPVMFGAVGSE
jgi:hypothetical protein